MEKRGQQSPTLCVCFFPSKAVFLAQCLDCNHAAGPLNVTDNAAVKKHIKESFVHIMRVHFDSCHV